MLIQPNTIQSLLQQIQVSHNSKLIYPPLSSQAQVFSSQVQQAKPMSPAPPMSEHNLGSWVNLSC